MDGRCGAPNGIETKRLHHSKKNFATNAAPLVRKHKTLEISQNIARNKTFENKETNIQIFLLSFFLFCF